MKLAILLLLVIAGSAKADKRLSSLIDNDSTLPRKKVIEFGSDHPSIEYIATHFADMETRPFDGLGIQLPASVGGGEVFRVDLWKRVTPQARAEALKKLAAIPAGKTLTDNFIALYGASSMRWTSDEDWKSVADNLRFCAQAARAARCKGILWDAESYGQRNPWRYQDQPDTKGHSFADYSAVVRRRGAEMVKALQSEFPNLVILSLRQLSDFQRGSPFSAKLFGEPNPKVRDDIQRNSWWALHIPFTVGMVEGLQGTAVLHDGNEEAYYYSSAIEFYQIICQLRTEAAELLMPASLRDKFATKYRIGHAVSTDYTSGRWDGLLKSFPVALTGQGKVLSPEQRARWFEHNLYHGLSAADEYVWVYTEHASWWEGSNIPPGYEEAIRSARSKVSAGQPLGFQVDEMLKDARAVAEKTLK